MTKSKAKSRLETTIVFGDNRERSLTNEGIDNTEDSDIPTVHDWESYKLAKDVFDDGTMTYFWRTHTLTVFFLMTCVLVYVALFEPINPETNFNIKRGLIACALVFILLGVTLIPDGPFLRPHPALWRLVFSVSIVYELALIFILFQTPDDARKLLRHIDPTLGKPLEERDYGGNCNIYDSHVPNNPFHNILDKFDVFVPLHFFGWWIKTIMMRDWWLCTVISIMFELLEYTLEHQLPNFSECWWDHWIMDALICNGLGIYLGMISLKYLTMSPYNWRGLWSIPTYRGKLKRIVAQFGPHSWIEFDWRPTSSLDRWIWVIFLTIVLLVAELNTFYLKFVLWLPPPHLINLARLVMFILVGAVSLRETFQYLDDPNCKNFGRQAWVALTILVTEFLIIAKFDWKTITKPVPTHILYFWIGGAITLIVWTLWYFFLRRVTKVLYKRKESESLGTSTNSHIPDGNNLIKYQKIKVNQPTNGSSASQSEQTSTNSSKNQSDKKRK